LNKVIVNIDHLIYYGVGLAGICIHIGKYCETTLTAATDLKGQVVLAKVVQFNRRSRRTPESRRRPWRLRTAPWPPLAALVGVAGALWFAVEGSPATMDTKPAPATDGHGPFVLCAATRQPNCVIDGDTIRYGGIKIRLADIDAPEVFSPSCPSEATRGKRATRRLLALINEGPFQLVAGGRDEDRYGRKLRTIERGGRSLGDTLVAEGLARAWDGARRSWCG
jgi:endonuclease YncB( thermonuclease family)